MRVRLPLTNRRVSATFLGAMVLIVTAALGAYAANVTITSTNNAAAQGVYVVANGYYTISNTAYYVVQNTQAATTQPLAWSNGAIGYVNAQTPGDWELSMTLTINAGGLTSHTYTITCYSTSGTGATTTLYTFQFTSPATITPSQTMTIIWDVGATTWTAPAALSFTVA
jgi:hypothetical protein